MTDDLRIDVTSSDIQTARLVLEAAVAAGAPPDRRQVLLDDIGRLISAQAQQARDQRSV